jgi:transcriptional regulator with XRE-family HTH domain
LQKELRSLKKSTNTVDKEIGSRVRMRRMLIGMSQEKLGEMLGLTFQQVQKYEKGANRISVSRLLDIAGILGVDIHYFYDGLSSQKGEAGFAEEAAPPYVSDFMNAPEGHQLMKAFMTIKNPKVRRTIIQLAMSLAADDEADIRSS